MNSDFMDAFERHWEDAELLLADQRYANADHLYGMSAECGLKSLMICFGMPVISGVPKRRDRRHANEIWTRFEAYRSGHRHGVGYVLPPNPFGNWDVDQRYAPRSGFNEANTRMHQEGASVVKGLIEKARKEGILQ
ncbi:MAG: SAM-dependent methyltransferase [Acidobacteriota bacterium]